MFNNRVIIPGPTITSLSLGTAGANFETFDFAQEGPFYLLISAKSFKLYCPGPTVSPLTPVYILSGFLFSWISLSLANKLIYILLSFSKYPNT